MNRTFCVAAAFLAAGAASGQITWSPLPMYASVEGGAHSSYFGTWHRARAQLGDASLRGKPQTIKAISYRPDYGNHTGITSGGRAWSSVQLGMSQFTLARMSRNPSANVAGPVTQVFRGRVVWKALVGFPLTRPARVSSAVFPFRTPWPYSGARDILCDYTFAGGALANRRAWSGSTRAGYALDSYAYDTAIAGTPRIYGGTARAGGCADSGNRAPYDTYGSSTGLPVVRYGPSHVSPVFRNRFLALFNVYHVGRGAPVITAIGGLHARGVNIPGVACNRLYVDFSGPVAIYTSTARSLLSFGFVGSRYLTGATPPYVVPVPASLVGVTVAAQSAWNDTRTKAMKLTGATANAIPPLPPWSPSATVPRRGLYEFYSGSSVLRLGPSQHGPFNPICGYVR